MSVIVILTREDAEFKRDRPSLNNDWVIQGSRLDALGFPEWFVCHKHLSEWFDVSGAKKLEAIFSARSMPNSYKISADVDDCLVEVFDPEIKDWVTFDAYDPLVETVDEVAVNGDFIYVTVNILE